MRLSRSFPRPVALTAALLLATTGAALPHLQVRQVAAATTGATVIRHGTVSHTVQVRDTIAALRSKVKYVFVLYQENRSFDQYFGSFPGANGLYSQPASQTPGYYQAITNTDGTTSTIQPFRIGPSQFAANTDDPDHSHALIDAKMDVVNGVPQMDRFAQVEAAKFGATTLKGKQYGELAMAYADCDTVPMLWDYAKNFTLFDNIYQQMTGPSTPGNLAIIGAQAGQSQQVLHPSQSFTDNGNSGAGVPMLNDRCALWGSSSDPYVAQTGSPNNSFRECHSNTFIGINLTFPTVLNSFEGPNAIATFANSNDLGGGSDIGDLSTSVVSGTSTLSDTGAIAAQNPNVVPWGWFEEGYYNSLDATNATLGYTSTVDPSNVPGTGNKPLGSYIVHHNGPQYFGYVMNNPIERTHLHSLTDFFNTVTPSATPPSTGGVYYVKGGYYNFLGAGNSQLTPSDKGALVQKNFVGDDDHPAYSDAQISELLVAKEVDAIARSPYWANSAIIITYDDSEGNYDHVPPPITNNNGGASSGFISDGPRVPFIVISPYSAQTVVHSAGDHGSVVKFVDALFNLTPLADLPNEYQARQTAATVGITGTGSVTETNYGPNDDLTPGIDNLIDAFDPNKLNGTTAPLPASLAEIPAGFNFFPTAEGQGCAQVGITPVSPLPGESNAVPADFQARPGTELSTTAATGTVSAAGATITASGANGKTTSLSSLVVPSGAVTEPVTLSAVGVISPSAATDPAGTVSVGDVLNTTALGADGATISSLTTPATATLTYSPATLPTGVTPGNLALYSYNPLTASFTRVAGSSDNGSGTVTAPISTLGYYQLRSNALPAGTATATAVAPTATLVAATATATSGGGNSTPELGSAELIAAGLLPLLAVLIYSRRRRNQTGEQGDDAE